MGTTTTCGYHGFFFFKMFLFGPLFFCNPCSLGNVLFSALPTQVLATDRLITWVSSAIVSMYTADPFQGFWVDCEDF